MIQRETEVAGGVGEEDEDGATDQLRTFAQLLQAERHYHTRHDLQQQELMRERYHQRADQHDDKVREKRRPGIEEGTYYDRYDGERQYIYVE